MADLDQHNTDYTFPLDEKSKKKAKDELNETDEERVGCVLALRDWALQNRAWLKTPTEFSFLLRYLRVRKFSQLAARKTLENFWTQRTKTPEWFADTDSGDPDIQDIVGTGYYLVIPGTDKEGRVICFERPGVLDVNWALKRFGVAKLMKGFMCIMDWMMLDQNDQVNGIVIVEDLTGFTMAHGMLYDLETTKKLLKIYQDAYPCRTKAMHLYNAPPIFEPFITMFKPFMKEKLRNRMISHGRKLTSVYKHVDMCKLPVEYLPDDYTGPNAGTAQEIIDNMKKEMMRPEVREHIRELSSNKYGVDLSKKPKDDEPQASFRKLNVS